MQAIYRAHSNIALIKYWGKKDEILHLPYNNSLSITQDSFYTDTEVEFSDSFEEDIFILNGEVQSETERIKISKFVDLLRELKGLETRARINSFNNMPTAAGFGSSASAYAALTAAINDALELRLSEKELSTYARRGSGSASRSIYGGLVEWHAGTDHESSFAEQIDTADWGLSTITVIGTPKQKKFSSRVGMQKSVHTSPFYKEWPNVAKEALNKIKRAIKERDIDEIGKIAEHNALAMHSLTITSVPPILYFNDKTMRAIAAVHEIRDLGYTAYFTIDAGPNIVIICPRDQAEDIMRIYNEKISDDKLMLSNAGPGIQKLESWVHD